MPVSDTMLSRMPDLEKADGKPSIPAPTNDITMDIESCEGWQRLAKVRVGELDGAIIVQ